MGGGGGGSGGGVGGGTGGGTALLPTGATCPNDSSCTSGLCRPVLTLTPTLATVYQCVVTCSSQEDCGDAGTFCMSVDGGAPPGLCVPPYPLLCATCFLDSDCGALSEVCLTAPGDVAACTIDCALSGASACPAGYSCEGVADGGARRWCRPTTGSCLDAAGGACSAGTAPLSCTRSSDAGTCLGTRTCDGGQYAPCDAAPPDCLATCATVPPAGCTLAHCAGVATTPTDCGSCGTACPGAGQATANVVCNAPACTFSCKGEAYDVNADASDGCEVSDTPSANHTSSAAVGLGSFSCSDSSSAQNFSGRLPSDARVHESPAVAGFDGASGSAPDFFSLDATGGLCTNNLNLTLTMTGAALATCYQLTAVTDQGTYSCATAQGTCSITNGSGSYSDGTTISISVKKTCSAAQQESPQYTVTGHL